MVGAATIKKLEILAASALLSLSGCSEKPASSGPEIDPSSAPGVAFSYRYSFLLASASVAPVQEQHAAACERLGASRCRITGMTYDVSNRDAIGGSLSLKLDRNLARTFGRDGVETVKRAGGRLTSASIEGEDVAPQINSAKTQQDASDQQTTDLEAKLKQPGLGDRERAKIRDQIEAFHMQSQEAATTQAEAGERLAQTPVTFFYDGGPASALSDSPFAGAGSALVASGTSMLSATLFAMAYGLPWVLLALLLVVLWNSRLFRRLRKFACPPSDD